MNLESIFWRTWNYLKFRMNGIEIADGIKGFNVKKRFYLHVNNNATVRVGKNFTFYSDSCLNPLSRNLRGCICVDENAEIKIGNRVGMSSAILWAKKGIKIGDRVTVGANVVILDSDCHSLNHLDRWTENDMKNCKCKPIVIEDDVLIGAGSYVLKGVHIGARSIIGAGSIVTSDIPADCIAAGNPARIIRYINQNNS